MADAFIIDACRTPRGIGKQGKGALTHLHPGHLGRTVLEALQERQVDTVRYIDTVFEELFDKVPKNTHIVVTADHGELFGEEGYFGHGPIMHEKCFEVPYLEGVTDCVVTQEVIEKGEEPILSFEKKQSA